MVKVPRRIVQVGAALMIATATAQATETKIVCAQESTMTAGWDGPIELLYVGEASGTLTVSSAHIALSLVAQSVAREADGASQSAVAITGVGDIEAVMPDLVALETCAAQSVPADFKDDADMVAVARIGCVASVPPGEAPVAIHAEAVIGLVPGETDGKPDVIVEIKRTYQDPSAPQAGPSLDTFPKDCVLAPP